MIVLGFFGNTDSDGSVRVVGGPAPLPFPIPLPNGALVVSLGDCSSSSMHQSSPTPQEHHLLGVDILDLDVL